jgi:nuclear transport factor 2 (NTF2) superfamily protein
MLIALDYDKTYTADPALWDNFVDLAQSRGHTVKIVTMRRPDEAIDTDVVDVVYTSRKAKSSVIRADIWIDDSPQWVYQDSV